MAPFFRQKSKIVYRQEERKNTVVVVLQLFCQTDRH